MDRGDFSAARVADFAALSGDHNPLHVDPLAARRLIFGRAVVHGVFVALWALDQWLATRDASGATAPLALTHLRAQFRAPVPVGALPTLRIAETDGALKLRVELDGQRACILDVRLAADGDAVDTVPDAPAPRGPCRERAPAELADAAGELTPCLARDLAAKLFPRLAARAPAWQLAALAATTRVVGMDCPGLHSIYSELEARFEPRGGGAVAWRAAGYDERVRRLLVDFASPGFTARATTFVRPAPHAQPTAAELSRRVAKGAFAGRRALVVGGSRGLGEVAAKMLAAGGADVVLTYHRGADDARRVVADIIAHGGSARAVALDVLTPGDDLAARLGPAWVPDQLYYFASPPIFVAAGGQFSDALFRTFSECYVQSFQAVARAVHALGAPRLAVFYPSSVAVEAPPANMAEYAAAKGAGEVLCRLLAATLRGVDVVVERLPRLATDQTASILAADNLDPEPVLARVLARMARGPGLGHP